MEDEQNKRISKYNPVPSERKQAIIDDALERIGNETLDQIAAAHGIDDMTLWRWLDNTPEYKPIMDAHYIDRLRSAVKGLDSVEGEIRASDDQFGLARARAIGDITDKRVKAAQWELERRVSAYHAKQDVTVDQRQVSFVVVAPVDKP